jgi:hypothetical protein
MNEKYLNKVKKKEKNDKYFKCIYWNKKVLETYMKTIN